ncbi:MAG: hypothetical protein HC792_05985 [Acaryochloridaceae cyanobacterium CSU_5_19]|nr:hypothetical protein [Acaryochloridaceae cyanobacterium CSU_5_19]
MAGSDIDLDAEQSIQDPSTQTSAPNAEPEISVPPTSAQVALIRPTSPDERLRVLKSGRSDPFAELVAPALPDVPGQPSSSQASQTIARRDSLPESSPNLGTKSPDLKLNPPQSKSGGSAPSPKIVLPSLPKPTPDLAQAVKVTGVMLISGQPRAIVEAPNESRSRTVGIGDLLSNNQVRVKTLI